MSEPQLRQEMIPLKSKIWVSLGDGACSLLQGFVAGGALTYAFTKWRGLDPSLAAVIWIIFGIWNAVNDPLFGFISDRTRSALGRRKPYIRYGSIVFGSAFSCCWINFPGSMGNQTVLFIQMLGLLFLYDTLYTAIATSLYVMPFEMAVSNKARSGIFIWKIILNVPSMIVPMVLFDLIKPNPGETAAMFQMVMIGIGIVMSILIFTSTFFYEEKNFTRQEVQPPFFTALVNCFKNRSFIIFEVISFTIIYVQAGLMQGVFYYFDEIGLSQIPLFAALGVGVLVGLVVFVGMREKWGVKNSVRAMALLFSIGCFIVLGFGRLLLPSILGFFCFGVGFSGGMYLIPLMNGDVVDMDEHRTGLRREGMYAGINSFITKPAISFANAVFLWILSAFQYDQTLPKGMQSPQAETGILTAWTLVPGILLFISFVVLHWYPLAGKEWDQIKSRLAKVHIDKEKKFLASRGIQYVE